jgi:hypothetical protein
MNCIRALSYHCGQGHQEGEAEMRKKKKKKRRRRMRRKKKEKVRRHPRPSFAAWLLTEAEDIS